MFSIDNSYHSHSVFFNQSKENTFPDNLIVPNDLKYLIKTSQNNINTCLLKALSTDEVVSRVKLFANSECSGAYNAELSSIEISPLPSAFNNKETYIAQQISALAHELSHARDHLEQHYFDSSLTSRLGKGADISDIKVLYRTELKAWIVEAMQCKLSHSTTDQMKVLLDSTNKGIDDVIHSPSNKFNARILAYKTQAGLPESWDVEKVLFKTKLTDNLSRALTLLSNIEIKTPDDAIQFMHELDLIFNY